MLPRLWLPPDDSPCASTDADNRGMAPEQVTVQQLADYWREVEAHKYGARSFKERDYHVRLFCLDLGSQLVSTLHVKDVLRWMASNPPARHANPRHKRRRGWTAPGTRQNVAKGILHLFNLGQRHGLIDRHNLGPLMAEFEASDPRRPVTDQEFQRMLRYATDALFRRLILFIRESSSRPGEAEALEWTHVRWEAGCCILDRHKTRKKTRKPRVIPLSRVALQLLQLLHRQAGNPSEGFVFLNSTGTRWSAQTLSKRMTSLRKRAGIPDDAYLVGLRHSALTDWVEAGMPLKLAAEIAGHTSVSTTERNYVDLRGKVETLRRAMEKYRKGRPEG